MPRVPHRPDPLLHTGSQMGALQALPWQGHQLSTVFAQENAWPFINRANTKEAWNMALLFPSGPSAHAHQGSPGLTAPHFPTLLIYSANVQCPPGLHSWTLFTKWGLSDPCPDSTLEQLLGTVVCRCPSLVGAELLQILQQESAPTQANTFLLVWRSLTII